MFVTYKLYYALLSMHSDIGVHIKNVYAKSLFVLYSKPIATKKKIISSKEKEAISINPLLKEMMR